MSLFTKQERMKKRQSLAVHEVPLHREKRTSRPQPEWVGPKTKCHLMREGLSTHVRDLRARLAHFEELGRKQHQERRYATEITYLTPQQLAEMSRYQR